MRSLQVIMTQLALQDDTEDSTTDMLRAKVCSTLLEISRLHMITHQLALSTKLIIAPLICYLLELPRLCRRYPCKRTSSKRSTPQFPNQALAQGARFTVSKVRMSYLTRKTSLTPPCRRQQPSKEYQSPPRSTEILLSPRSVYVRSERVSVVREFP